MPPHLEAGEFQPLARPQLDLRRVLFYFITLAALVLIYLKFAEIRLIQELFLKSNLAWLGGIIITQVLSFYALALNYRDVLRVKDLTVGVKELFPITFVIQFLNQALPSATLSGQAFFVQYLKKYGLTVAEGIGRAVVELVTLGIAFGVFFLAASVLIYKFGVVADRPEVSYLVYLFVFIGLTFGFLFFALQKRKRGTLARWLIQKLHQYFEKRGTRDHTGHLAVFFDQVKVNVNISELGKRKRALAAATFWQGMVLLLSVIALYLVALAIGYPLAFPVAFVTFTLTKFISMFAFIPGALGVFEGGMTLILVSFGNPAQPAFAITLLFRAFTFWFPMPIGWILFRYISHRQELAQRAQ